MFTAMFGCCAPCHDSGASQFDFSEPLALDEDFAAATVDQQSCISKKPQISARSNSSLAPESFPSVLGGESQRGVSQITPDIAQATILSHLHGTSVQRSTSNMAFAKTPIKTRSVASVDDFAEQSQILQKSVSMASAQNATKNRSAAQFDDLVDQMQTIQKSVSMASAQNPTKTHSLVSLDDHEERQRMIAMVRVFAKQAVQGCSCVLVEGIGNLTPAKYLIEQS